MAPIDQEQAATRLAEIDRTRNAVILALKYLDMAADLARSETGAYSALMEKAAQYINKAARYTRGVE